MVGGKRDTRDRGSRKTNGYRGAISIISHSHLELNVSSHGKGGRTYLVYFIYFIGDTKKSERRECCLVIDLGTQLEFPRPPRRYACWLRRVGLERLLLRSGLQLTCWRTGENYVRLRRVGPERLLLHSGFFWQLICWKAGEDYVRMWRVGLGQVLLQSGFSWQMTCWRTRKSCVRFSPR